MPDRNYLCLEVIDNSSTFQLKRTGSTLVSYIEYSTDDGSTWTSWSVGGVISLNVGDKLYLRRSLNTIGTFSQNTSNYLSIYSPGKFKVSGNIMSLVDKTCQSTTIPAVCCFFNLFYGNSNLTDISGLLLPATTLSDYCYFGMFEYCTSLTNSCKLPATTLINNCYKQMFKNCTSLKRMPDLPATVLAASCYANMFQNCTSIKVSSTREYDKPFRIPSNNDASLEFAPAFAFDNMLAGTGGSYTGNPTFNFTYYTEGIGIVMNVNNLTHDAPSEYEDEYSPLTITLGVVDGISLPSSVNVSGASYTYNSTTGEITLSEPLGLVTITAEGKEQLFAPTISIENENNLKVEYIYGADQAHVYIDGTKKVELDYE